MRIVLKARRLYIIKFLRAKAQEYKALITFYSRVL